MQLGFKKGIVDGLPICFGYLSVAFAFGIFAMESGLNILESVLISMTNVTSAGQLAAVPIIATGGTVLELAGSQLVINMRYALMSVSLSQKLNGRFKPWDKLLVAFVNTDEVFAVVSSQKGKVNRAYMYGLIVTPYIGWSCGTLLGAAAGNIFPPIVLSALGIAIYAMFVAIVVPQIRQSRPTAVCVLLAVVFSCAFTYLPLVSRIPEGFRIIICATLSGAVLAIAAPVQIKEEVTEDAK